jgi:hypothetical protein
MVEHSKGAGRVHLHHRVAPTCMYGVWRSPQYGMQTSLIAWLDLGPPSWGPSKQTVHANFSLHLGKAATFYQSYLPAPGCGSTTVGRHSGPSAASPAPASAMSASSWATASTAANQVERCDMKRRSSAWTGGSREERV